MTEWNMKYDKEKDVLVLILTHEGVEVRAPLHQWNAPELIKLVKTSMVIAGWSTAEEVKNL